MHSRPSYEAKAFGVKTGTQVGEAKKLCPGIILIAGDHADYAQYSHDIGEAVELACPVSHRPSIDEMVCQLMGREQEPPRARQIALEIKQSIYKNVGVALRCSIAWPPNRYLAKIASDMQKPDGLIGLLPSQLPRAIAHLALRDLPGVGARTEARLNAKGVTTMEQLLALDHNQMNKLFDSVWGNRMYHWLRGAQTEDAAGNNTSQAEGAEIPRPLPRPRARTPLSRRLLGRRTQAPSQSCHAPSHGALLHRLSRRHRPLPAHTRTS